MKTNETPQNTDYLLRGEENSSERCGWCKLFNTEVTAHGLKGGLFPSIRRAGNDEDVFLAPREVYLSKQVSYSELAKLTATNPVEGYLVPFEQASPRETKCGVPRGKLPGPWVTVHRAHLD